jgi:hypothetical protein
MGATRAHKAELAAEAAQADARAAEAELSKQLEAASPEWQEKEAPKPSRARRLWAKVLHQGVQRAG